MRSNVAYLVVLMVMLGCFAVFQLRPLGLFPFPGNLVLGALLFCGAAAVALRRPFSYPAGVAASLAASVGGLLSFRGWLGTSLPGHPVVWIVAGLYVAFRLTLNRQVEADKRPEPE
jgi:hypothetical protein